MRTLCLYEILFTSWCLGSEWRRKQILGKWVSVWVRSCLNKWLQSLEIRCKLHRYVFCISIVSVLSVLSFASWFAATWPHLLRSPGCTLLPVLSPPGAQEHAHCCGTVLPARRGGHSPELLRILPGLVSCYRAFQAQLILVELTNLILKVSSIRKIKIIVKHTDVLLWTHKIHSWCPKCCSVIICV